MMTPPEQDPNEPYPTVRGAMMLTVMAMFAAGFTGIAFIDFGLLAAVGIGQAIGVGAVASIGAQRVPEPQAQRLGLRALDPALIPMILCLVPAILLQSELDNFAADFGGDSPAAISQSLDAGAESGPDTVDEKAPAATEFDPYLAAENALAQKLLGKEKVASGSDQFLRSGDDDETIVPEATEDGEASEKLIDIDDPASVFQAFIVMVGISPVVEEFLYRGVIQQGLVQRLGLLRGVSLVAFFWALLRPVPMAGVSRFLAAGVASFALGWLLGIVRIATGSILGPILLASSWAAVGLAALALEGRMDLPGLNVEGSHLPLLVTLASLILVGWTASALFRVAEKRFEEDQKALGPKAGGDADGPGSSKGKPGGVSKHWVAWRAEREAEARERAREQEARELPPPIRIHPERPDPPDED